VTLPLAGRRKLTDDCGLVGPWPIAAAGSHVPSRGDAWRKNCQQCGSIGWQISTWRARELFACEGGMPGGYRIISSKAVVHIARIVTIPDRD